MAIKITDLVDQQAIDRLKELDGELKQVLDTFKDVAKELVKGLDINVTCTGDIDKLEKIFIDKTKEAAAANDKLNRIVEEQRQIIGNTSNTISRHLMEQERVNKAQRETYTEYDRVKKLLEQFHDTYEGQTQRLVRLKQQLAENTKEQKNNEKALAQNRVTMEQFTAKQAELIAQHRSLTQEKRTLTQIMTAEEKAAQSQETSYVHMSQQLELLKKAYKDLSVESRSLDFGKELEEAIQNLDAHLKDVSADMGEFQRNVGNYAIAGQNGVVATESLLAVLQQQAVTIKDVSDQSKILSEARSMLDTTDAKYTEVLGLINDKLSENSRKLADVSDIMNVQATTVAEAEAQNRRLVEAIKQVDQTGEGAQATIDGLNAKIDENNRVIEAGNASKASVKKNLKELVIEIATLSIEYQNLSENEKTSADGQALADHIRDLTERAGILKDAIADTNQAITNASSDTRGFDQLSGAIQLAIDGFGLAQGAAAMLGISEEELAEIQTKLQAAIAASNAMQSIQNALQGQSALMQGVNLVQTKLRTTAENLHTAAQGKGIVATTALTAAQWAFNAAANANPIGLVVAAIVACIAAVWGLVKAFTAFLGPSDEALENYREQKEALDELCTDNDKLIDRMKARGASEAELLTQSLQNKEAEQEAADILFSQAKKLYDEDEDEYKAALEAKNNADEEFARSKEDRLNYLSKIQSEVYAYDRENAIGTLAYKIEVIEAEKKKQLELAEMLYENGEMTRQMYEDIVASVNKMSQIKIDKAKESETKKVSPSKSSSSRVNNAKKEAEELKKAVQAGEDALLQIIADGLERERQTEINSYERKLRNLQEQLSKTKESHSRMRQALNNQIEGLEAEHQRKMEDIERKAADRQIKTESDLIESHLAIVEKGSEEELNWKLKALNNQYHAELNSLQEAEDSKTLTVEQAEEMRTNLAIKYFGLREQAEEEHAAGMAQKIEERYERERSDRDNAMLMELNSLKSKYAEELTLAKGNADKQAEIKKKYEEDQVRITEKYAIATAQSSVSMLEEVLKNENLSADERLKYEQALAKAKTDLAGAVADAQKRAAEEAVNADNEATEKRIANAQKWLQVASESLGAINDLVSSVYDAKISKVEEEQEANTAAGEAEKERISDLVEKNVITEEEGEARKRAAEDKTAKKNEELEKKKQKLKQKQAVWDKANSLAQAGIATALAIMNALQMKPFPVGIAMAAIAGAMGAVQIATILATPIPKYAKGTDYHKGGPAIVGDGGVSELILFKNGKSWLSPDTPTLVDLPAGAMVIPEIDIIGPDGDIPGYAEAKVLIPEQKQSPLIVNNDYRRLEEKIDLLTSTLKKHSNRQHKSAIDIALAQYISDRI